MAKTNTELQRARPRRRSIEELRATKQEALNLRFRNATGQLDNNAEIRKVRRQIARINTLHPPARDRCRRGREVSAVMPRHTDNRRPQPSRAATRRKVREGVVVSNKMDKTAVVAVIERVRHAKYAKFVMRTKKLYAHDETNDVNIGDKVRVMETRPLSKNKRWRVVEVLERAK